MPTNIDRRDFAQTGRLPLVPDSSVSDQDVEEFKATVLAKLTLAVGKDAATATDRDWFVATALALRDRIIHRWLTVDRASYAKGRKRVYYMSLEFLIGRLFNDVVGNLRCNDVVNVALGDLGVDPARMRCAEPDAALGNGGLGRLAACFMESMASLGIPACGYGIRYDHGLFQQVIKDGWQQEYPEQWLSFGNPWEFERPEVNYDIQFGGCVETIASPNGRSQSLWHPEETIKAVAYDTIISVLCRRKHGPKRSQRFSTRAMIRNRGENCVYGRNTSLFPPLCKTLSIATPVHLAASTRSLNGQPFNSTTRIRASPSPS